jgi:hypothetical protein
LIPDSGVDVNVMKSAVVGFALLATMTFFAKERPAVRVPAPPSVTVENPKPPVVEKRSVETTGRGGCDSKTVRRDGPEGSTTVKEEHCD